MQSDRAALRQRFTCDVRNDNRRRSFPRISHIPMYSRGGGVRFSKLRKSNGLATNHGHSFAHNTQKHSFADFVRMVGRSSIMRQKIDPTRLSNFLFQIAAVIYAISLFTRSALTHLAFAPSLKTFSRPLAATLQFITNELQGLTLLPVVSICIIAGIVMRSLPKFSETPQKEPNQQQG